MSVRTGNTIRHGLCVLTLVIVAALAVAPRASAQTLTNADVIKMVQAKLGDAVIISEIKNSTCKFDTSPNALIKLKEAGVSDKVLQAMTEAGHAGTRESGGATVASSNANVSIPGKLTSSPTAPLPQPALRTASGADISGQTERAVVAGLQEINAAERVYASRYRKGFSESLKQLGPPREGSPTNANHAGLLGASLASGEKNGYLFEYGTGGTPGFNQSYSVQANHTMSGGAGGWEHYYTDQSGGIWRSPEYIAGPGANGQVVTAGLHPVCAALLVPPQPTTRAAPSTNPPSARGASQPSATCSGATDLGYSIQDGERTYKVEALGPPGPNRIHIFLDETGAVVRDRSELQKLALGAWTKEIIVDRYDPGIGSGQVKTFLAVSSTLEGWEDVTDVLARSTVESITAAVTGGASLDTAAQNLTLGAVEQQLTNPKVALAHWARAGLDQSLADYTRMEGLLPPAGTTVLKLPDLEKIESLYTQANTLASVNEALAAAIAPTTWQDEFANYISSALSELKPSLPASGVFLTLNSVLKLEQLVAATGQSFSAYKRSLDLAQKVAGSDQQKISAWAAQAFTCGSSGPGGVQSTEIDTVDFLNFNYPSGCWKSYPNSGFGQIIRVSNGKWNEGTGNNQIFFEADKPLYADLTGDGQDEAVVTTSCGFTAGNAWDTEVFVFGIVSRTPKLLARLSSSDWAEPSWGIDWGVNGIRVENDEIIVNYIVGGSHAQPEWTATANFRWNGSRFVRATLDRKPFSPR
jgi:hypothetical protein